MPGRIGGVSGAGWLDAGSAAAVVFAYVFAGVRGGGVLVSGVSGAVGVGVGAAGGERSAGPEGLAVRRVT